MGNVIWIVGIGPGAREFMTGQAVAAIEESERSGANLGRS